MFNAEYRGRGSLSPSLSAQLIPSYKGYRSHIGYMGEIAIRRGIKGALVFAARSQWTNQLPLRQSEQVLCQLVRFKNSPRISHSNSRHNHRKVKQSVKQPANSRRFHVHEEKGGKEKEEWDEQNEPAKPKRNTAVI